MANLAILTVSSPNSLLTEHTWTYICDTSRLCKLNNNMIIRTTPGACRPVIVTANRPTLFLKFLIYHDNNFKHNLEFTGLLIC